MENPSCQLEKQASERKEKSEVNRSKRGCELKEELAPNAGKKAKGEIEKERQGDNQSSSKEKGRPIAHGGRGEKGMVQRGICRKEIKKRKGSIGELTNVFAQRNGKVEILPLVPREKPFHNRPKEKKRTPRRAEKLFRFEFSHLQKSGIANREDERSKEKKERQKRTFQEEITQKVPSFLR